MNLKFINREDELSFLEKRFENKNFEFFVIYGRRRIGKTELIKRFLKEKPHLYFLCDQSGTDRNILRLKLKISDYLQEPIIASEELEELFEYFLKKANKRIVIVFDEFSYLVEKDSSIPSIFQVLADEVFKKNNMLLILCGSSISMMEKGILSHNSPLYGRKTAHIKLLPIKFHSFFDFFPSNTLEKNVEFYSVLGGVPFYLEKFSQENSTFDNIKNHIFSKEGKLYEEIDFLLREELREPDVYKTILSAIASGSTKVVDIANKSKIKAQDIDKYLKVLIRLGAVKREVPITEKKSKKSIYMVDDNFFNFCFTFCETNKSDLEIGEIDKVLEKLRSRFPSFVGKGYEKLIREEFLRRASLFPSDKVGRWWGHYRDKENKRKEVEIDIAALNEEKKEILFAECKWQDKADAEKILSELKEKSKYVEWNNEQRKEHFAIFAKSFKDKKIKDVMLFDLKDIEKFFKKRK